MVGGEVVLTEIYLLEVQRWAWSSPTKRNKGGTYISISAEYRIIFSFLDS